MQQIAVSGGSACNSGVVKASHVLEALNADTNIPALRFSFSKYNTFEELDFSIEALKKLLFKN